MLRHCVGQSFIVEGNDYVYPICFCLKLRCWVLKVNRVSSVLINVVKFNTPDSVIDGRSDVLGVPISFTAVRENATFLSINHHRRSGSIQVHIVAGIPSGGNDIFCSTSPLIWTCTLGGIQIGIAACFRMLEYNNYPSVLPTLGKSK